MFIMRMMKKNPLIYEIILKYKRILMKITY